MLALNTTAVRKMLALNTTTVRKMLALNNDHQEDVRIKKRPLRRC